MLHSAILLCSLIAADAGVLPTDASGRPLNLDFETGDLRDWTAAGNAFKNQPIQGDTVSPRRPNMKSRHQGNFWVGGWEKGTHDAPQGTLTSATFTVTHPWASFLVGGGGYPTQTCVELVRADTMKVAYRASGLAEEDLRRVAVDLRSHMGKPMFIRLVDKHTGHWGHVNFDDFRFHSAKPEVAARPQPREALNEPADVIANAGLSPERAAQVMTVPEQFEVKLFAGEPDVTQPIAFCIDDRGRLWVVEAHTYPQRAPEGEGKDRIIIFEDVDGDGKHDKRTVFMDGLNLVSGIELGFGGVYVGAAPYLYFIPLDETKSKPAGPPKVLLDGWGYEDTHETLNTFTWGPDGWLYGCHGVFTHSKVGKPGTPDKDRVRINAGIWRYHPVRHEFEVFAEGTSNPWGLDFNDKGDLFIEACVIPHCFHMVQGGRYQRQAGSHFNPYTYIDIQTCADHLHYLGATPHGGNNRSDAAGGGHAHAGLLCYQGGLWPQEFRNHLYMGNIHGRRLNCDTLKPNGSGYTASHAKDFLKTNDAWSRIINLQTGPDGNVYFIDWYDAQACHHKDPNIWDRTNGRIFKICLRGSRPVTGVDMAKLSDKQLGDLQRNANDWYVRHARRILQERAAAGRLETKAEKYTLPIALSGIEDGKSEVSSDVLQIRVYLLIHSLGLSEMLLEDAIVKTTYPNARAWAIQLLLEKGTAPVNLLEKLKFIAREEPSAIVRRSIASNLQRLKFEKRWDILAGLLSHAEDAADPNLPCLYWYAAEPLAAVDSNKALALTKAGKLPVLHGLMVRRVSAIGTPEALAAVVKELSGANDEAKLTVLSNMQAGLKGRRRVGIPAGWNETFASLKSSANAEIRSRATALATQFGDPAALTSLREVLVDAKAGAKRRIDALDALLAARDASLPPVLQKLVGDSEMRSAAIKGLASYADAKTPDVLLAIYKSLAATEKRDVLVVLASRPAYAAKLLDAVAGKQIPTTDLPAELVRQLRSLNDETLSKRIAEVWGVVRDTPTERKKLISEWRTKLATSHADDDMSLGRAVFVKTCAQCHTLYGVGSNIGPDITGSNRSNLDYLLENIFDPAAVIPKEYAATKVVLGNGRSLIGIVKQETPQAITLATADETMTIPVGDIEQRSPSDQSMMPDDLTKNHSISEIRALIAYLRHNAQVPILATKDNAKDLFNGKDLTGWDGDKSLWSVESGEIVGKSPGIKRNEFLKSHYLVGDFKLSVKAKLTPDKENSGIQVRSEPLTNGEMKGPQADIGAGWWGKLYEESGRGLLWSKPGDQHVKKGEWNDYVVEAKGDKIRTWINGQPCVDLDDPKISKRGVLAFQIHSGGAMEVRFKDMKLEVLP